MAGKGRGAELPRRVPGTAPADPVSPVAPVLSEELRQRMLAAVMAERAEAAARGVTLDEARLAEVSQPERYVARLGPVFDRLERLT